MFYSIFDKIIFIMKRILLFVFLFTSFAVIAQENTAPAFKATFDLNEKLYPQKDEDGGHSVNPEAAMQAIYFDNSYSESNEVVLTLTQRMELIEVYSKEITEKNKVINCVAGIMDNGPAGRNVVEIYITKAEPAGIVLMMSYYPESHKKIYEAEGKKAILSAVVNPL